MAHHRALGEIFHANGDSVPQPLLDRQSKSKSKAKGDADAPPSKDSVRSETELGLQCAGAGACDSVPKMTREHCDACSHVYFVKQMRDVPRSHSNTTVTGRTAN